MTLTSSPTSEPQSWEERFDAEFPDFTDLPSTIYKPEPGEVVIRQGIKSFITSELSRREAEVRETPMGVSQWREHGKKYQYWDFFERRIREEIAPPHLKKR